MTKFTYLFTMKPAERIWILVARKLSGEASAYDIAELEELLKKNPEKDTLLIR